MSGCSLSCTLTRCSAVPGTEGFFESSVEAWLTSLAGQRAAAGADEAAARVQARLGLAVARGLLLDLLATGDRDGVTQAFEHYLQVVEASYPATAAGPAGDLLTGEVSRYR